MVTFTALAKNVSVNFFSNTKVVGFGKNFTSEKFHVHGIYQHVKNKQKWHWNSKEALWLLRTMAPIV